MKAHLANSFHFQPERHVQITTISDWIRQKLDARRARRIEIRNIAYLRTLDRHLLDDMGVDIASLGEVRPKLASFNAHAVVISAIVRPTLPVNTSSR